MTTHSDFLWGAYAVTAIVIVIELALLFRARKKAKAIAQQLEK